MKKIILLIFVFTSVTCSLVAQWTQRTVNTTYPLFSVHYYSATTIGLGGYNQIFISGNGGYSWSSPTSLNKDSLGNYIVPADFESIRILGPSTFLTDGIFNSTGYDGMILRTTNGGSTWRELVNNTNGFITSFDWDSTRMVAVGNNGVIGISNNTGSAWTFPASGTIYRLYDARFISYDTILAGGSNNILRSFDGGVSWTDSTFSGNVTQIRCKKSTVLMVIGSYLYLSNNSGKSYSRLSTPFTAGGAIAVVSKDTLLANGADGLYVSNTGGQYWERYILPSFDGVAMISLLNSKCAFGVGGNEGYAIQTTNLPACPTQPATRFSVKGNITGCCLGDSITLLDSTPQMPNYTYQWKLGKTVFSTQYNSGIKLNTAGTYTIYLVVNNGTAKDSVSTTITVTGHYTTPLVIIPSVDSTCSGNLVGFSVPNSVTGISYQLRQGYTKVGSAQTGNGGTLYFTSANGITTQTAFNIKSLSVTACYTDSIIAYDTIKAISSANEPAKICTPVNNYNQYVGISNVTFGNINNTTAVQVNNYFDYACCQQTTVLEGHTYPISITTFGVVNYWYPTTVKVWIDYNDDSTFNSANELAFTASQPTMNTASKGTITIPATFALNKTVRMRVVDDQSSLTECQGNYSGQTADYAITIVPDTIKPTAAFTFTSVAKCNTVATFTNTSYNGTSFLWNFGDSEKSTARNPSHTYTVSGTYTITLTATNQTGVDSTKETIAITIPSVPVPATCSPTAAVGSSCTERCVINGLSVNGVSAGGGGNFYNDNTCTAQVHLTIDSTYIMSYYTENTTTGNSDGSSCAWIDYANDGNFDGAGSNLLGDFIGGSDGEEFDFTVPKTAVTNKPLRLRVISSSDGGFYMCGAICGNYVDMTVIIDTFPRIALAFVANTNTCPGDTVTFYNSTANGTTYLWDFGDGSTSTLKKPTHVYTVPGVYSVKLKACNSFYCDSLIKNNYITINPLPVVKLVAKDSICPGLTDTLKVTGAAVNYTWNTGATTNSIIVAPTATTTYSVKITSLTSCINDTAISISLHSNPVISTTTSGAAICKNSSSLNDTITAAGAATYIWSPNATINTTTGATVIVDPTATKTYTVTGTSSAGCKTSKAVAVVVSVAPYVQTFAVQNSICLGDSTQIEGIGANTYVWKPSTGLSSGTVVMPMATPTVTTTYTVTGTTSGCSDTASVIITVNTVPTIAVTGDSVICSGNTSTLTANGASNYTWVPATGLSETTGASVLANPVSNTTYTITGSSSNSTCRNGVQTIAITVNPTPTLSITGDSILCSGNSTTLTATGATSYLWFPGITTSPGLFTSPAATTTYTIIGTTNGCNGTATRTVNVFPSNGFDLAGNLSVCIDTPSFTNASIQACIFNNRCMLVSGALKLILDTAFHITSTVADSVAHISGDTLIWNYDSLSDISKTHCVSLTGSVSNVPAGDSVFVTMLISPVAGDSVPANNSITYWVKPTEYKCQGLPFDPNEKSVIPQGDISATQQLAYTIHFQNTGTAPAHNVVVVDTLSPYVDPTTLQVTSASSDVVISFTAGNIATFTFNNINLPDTATSKTSSIGIVKYTINPMVSVVPGNVINNHAGIYFDANAEVITNTTSNTIAGVPTSVSNIATSLNMAVFPNPFATTTSIVFNTNGTHYLELDDVTGRKLEAMECTGRQYELQRGTLAAGVYFIKAFDADKNYVAVQKVVVQ